MSDTLPPWPSALLREQLDGAADGVAARQRALRTAQDFDALEVEQVEQRAGQRGQVDVVDVQADARFQREVEVGLADAADVGDEAGAVGLRLRREEDVGRLRGDFVDAGLAARLEHVAGDRGDGERRFLQILAAELRGHDDFFELVCLLRLLRLLAPVAPATRRQPTSSVPAKWRAKGSGSA